VVKQEELGEELPLNFAYKVSLSYLSGSEVNVMSYTMCVCVYVHAHSHIVEYYMRENSDLN
jgi:hypothetical protein